MRGPFSAMYGNSSGGVIQMFTRQIPKTPEVSGDMLFGSFGTRRESVQATGTRAGVDYLLNFSNFESDGYRAQSASEKRQGTAKPQPSTSPANGVPGAEKFLNRIRAK